MHPTRNTLSESVRGQSAEILNLHLSAAIDLQSQLKQAHWNVRGPGFLAVHTLFDSVSKAVDAFAEVGPGNHFFGSSHTLRHYETAFWDSELSDNEPFEKWELAGSDDAATRANRLWKKRLREYEAPALDDGKREALHDYVARKKAGMADAWH